MKEEMQPNASNDCLCGECESGGDYLPVNGPQSRNEGVNEGEEDISPSPGKDVVTSSRRRLSPATRLQAQVHGNEGTGREAGDQDSRPRHGLHVLRHGKGGGGGHDGDESGNG